MATAKNILDFTRHEKSTFLIGGYRVKKEQDKWIFGIKPERDTVLYNTRFTLTEEARSDGSMGTGEMPDFVVLYDYTKTSKVRLFECVEYSIHTYAEMRQMKYPYPHHHSYIVYKLGQEFDAKDIHIPSIIQYAHGKYPAYVPQNEVEPVIVTGADILRTNRGEMPLQENYPNIRIIDLFAGLGGFHHAFDKLGKEMGFNVECVFTSELQEDLRHQYAKNYNMPYERINPDITLIKTTEDVLNNIPEHDVLCAGFPCQPFSKAGKQQGFNDEAGRGVLFNYIAKIIEVRRPKYIFLENVANLYTHDNGNTWQVIYNRLSSPIEQGGLNYDVRAEVLSPHEYGLPQHRKRIYIVGVARERGTFRDFTFPLKPQEATCDINTIVEKEPKVILPVADSYRRYMKAWQQFLILCVKNKADLPHAPIWGMEFGATYPYETINPAKMSVEQLHGYFGSLGEPITGDTLAECMTHLPNYVKKSKDTKFPDWKIKFIRENRAFYEKNKAWIDEWKEQLKGWEDSFIKFEWNCPENNYMTIWDKIIQFRPSGMRVKMPNYSPTLTFMSSQVPIFPWLKYTLPDGTKGTGRYMTMKEGANLQGMGELSFEGLSKPRIYEALGNAVDVDIVKLIAKKILIS